jgi:hypothetical protein
MPTVEQSSGRYRPYAYTASSCAIMVRTISTTLEDDDDDDEEESEEGGGSGADSRQALASCSMQDCGEVDVQDRSSEPSPTTTAVAVSAMEPPRERSAVARTAAATPRWL